MADGRIARFEVPEGTTPDEVTAFAESQMQPEEKASGGIGRQVGLTARHALEGVAGLAGIVADPIGAVGSKITGAPYQPLQQAVGEGLTRMGVPEPETATERVVGGASRALVGGGGFVRGGQMLAQQAPRAVRAVGEALSTAPATQGASAITGGGAAEIARESGAGPGGQAVAGVVGGLAPGAALAGGSAAVRGGFRGGEAGRQRVADNIEAFKTAGTVPTVGQATEGRMARASEALLSRVPGGAGPVVTKAEAQADDIGAGLDRIASGLSGKRTAVAAGQSVERGIKGDGGFVEQFKGRQQALYDQLDPHVSGQQVAVNATRKALDDMSADIPGAPNLSQWFKNARISGIRGALVKDTEGVEALMSRTDIPPAFKKMLENQEGAELLYTLKNLSDGTLPYDALKKLRTLVGNEMADSGLSSDVPRSKWKKLYGAISEDLGTAVKGNKQAENAWNRANNYTRSGMRRLEILDRVMDKNGGPEAVFKAATSGTKEGATTLRAVMQSLPKENQRDLAAAMVRRLGKAVSSKQGADGDTFSTETFLTNWNNLSVEAKSALFDRFGPRFKQDMNRVAQVAANLRKGSKVFANPSGTSQGVAQATAVTAFVMSILTGNFGTAGGIVAGATAANGLSRLMVKPEFVSWLAQTTRVPANALNQQIVILDRIAKRTGDQDIADFAETLSASSREQSQPEER